VAESTIHAVAGLGAVGRAVIDELIGRGLPVRAIALLALVNPTLRAVREQQYQREAPWVVDHSKFARAFGAEVTPHGEAIKATIDWYATAG
jgi:hypothetical protein